MTRRNLELVESLRGEAAGTLLDVLDRTSTPMGARLLRQWILAPLSNRVAINARLDRVEALANDSLARAALRDALDGVRDIERLAGKVAASRATPRELRSLGDSLSRLPDVRAAIDRLGPAAFGDASPVAVGDASPAAVGDASPAAFGDASPAAFGDVSPAAFGDVSPAAFGEVRDGWDPCDDLAAAITRALVERPPMAIGDEPTIATGIDAGVDELRVLRDGGKDAIAEIQAAERARTGIASLKVGYNRVFGYFIEVTNANKDAVPADYQRRQTLTGAERYVTPALKEYEERVLTAAERLEVRERELFEALRSATGAGIARLQHVARRVAELDVVATFAEVAERERFVRPVVTDDLEIDIVGGRHPVVERMMPREQFIPNDVRLSTAERVIILTGPNMAGKSTILRQVGLIVLLAQAGSFVPAARATIGIVDRLFTRVGASDNLVRGQSTFMVEMAETSAILHTATARSLVLLDEIGRGTSTYDGVSIAWSVTEHLHSRVGCKTIFATHYHELTQLADELPALRNYNVAVREVGDRILFLHRMQPGGADRSYGIEVGRLAGLPDAVITRAREVLRRLESEQLVTSRPVEQLALFAPEPHAAIKRLAALNPDDMTPLQALTLLAELKGLV
ncbi:MAG TPA: DNA mismatch repair protein MutS [Gemmatimonadaceae bacterium]|nr:DNA mismatch repair protein MutS [Gemmatimonadaceae bacterium]